MEDNIICYTDYSCNPIQIDLELNTDLFQICKNSFTTNKVLDIIKQQKIVELQEKVDLLYGEKLYKAIPKLYKFKFSEEEVIVVCIITNNLDSNITKITTRFKSGKLILPYGKDCPKYIEVGEDGTFEVGDGDTLGCTTFHNINKDLKLFGKVLYEENTIMDDPKFLKKLLRNYYKFM